MYGAKTEYVYENFSKDKEMFNFSNYSIRQKIMMIQINQWLVK